MPCRSFIGEVELGGELGNGPTLCCILRFRVDMGERELRCESGEHELWLGMGDLELCTCMPLRTVASSSIE